LKTTAFATTAVDAGTDIITLPGHGLEDGEPAKFTSTTTVPSPLVAGATYYVEVVTSNTIKLHAAYSDAIAHTVPCLNLSDVGVGMHTIHHVRRRVNCDVIPIFTAATLDDGKYNAVFRAAFTNTEYMVSGTVKNSSGVRGAMSLSYSDTAALTNVLLVTQNCADGSYANFPEVHVVIYP
jgi:hypothetical protein